MAYKFGIFEFDSRGLPDQIFNNPTDKDKDKPKKEYVEAVQAELTNTFKIDPSDKATTAAVVGLLLIDEYFDKSAPSFNTAIRAARDELLRKVPKENSAPVIAQDIYKYLEEHVPKISGRATVFFQEFASVGRFAISRADELPFGNALFDRQIANGLDQYVAGGPTFDSLDLPALTGADGTDQEIVAENIKAVSMVYASYQLDVGMRMIDVVDRINEVFHNGQLPIGFDAAGKALDDYNWSAEDRMNASIRRTHYSRVLGSAGGDVSKDVLPNTQFESLFIRFLSSLAEYDRQQRVADLVANIRPQNLASEYVRKAGRDLAANLSLYGWAATQFAARRLRGHIEVALGILNQPSVQSAYGATNLYQVIERVSSSEFNTTPNIVKYRTMAEAGKGLIDLIAKYHFVWNKSNGIPVFDEPETTGEIGGVDKTSFFTLTQQWLAVNGIKDAQVDQYSEPEISQYAPSIPSFGGFNGGSSPGTSPDQMERIKQMVTQGQMPSLDQLQGMFNGGGVKMGV
jgi:hypothetical protein